MPTALRDHPSTVKERKSGEPVLSAAEQTRLSWARPVRPLWLVPIGTTGFFVVLTAAGLIQGSGWLNGETVYRILPQIQVYMILRAMFGILFVAAAVLGTYNTFMSIAAARRKLP